jgi:hypothetical protein
MASVDQTEAGGVAGAERAGVADGVLAVDGPPSAAVDEQHAGAAQGGDQPGDKVAGLFTNEASALRLVGAVLMEISQDWETGHKYLTMGPG